jgi:hypothetical protein
MTVSYSLTRLEVVRTYLFAMPRSPRIALVVLIICAWPGLVHVVTKRSLAPHLGSRDFLFVLFSAACIFFLLLVLVFFRAKTSQRILTISDQGIYTEIGKMKADYPWSKVKEVRDVKRYILLVNRSGNAFFIPDRAFTDSAQKTAFLAEIDKHREAKHGTN